MGADPRAALLAWCDETERIAREATPGPWQALTETALDGTWMGTERTCHKVRVDAENAAISDSAPTSVHIARHDPSSVLTQVAAIRAVVRLHKPYDGDFDYTTCFLCGVADGSWPCTTLLELADGFTPRWPNASCPRATLLP